MTAMDGFVSLNDCRDAKNR